MDSDDFIMKSLEEKFYESVTDDLNNLINFTNEPIITNEVQPIFKPIPMKNISLIELKNSIWSTEDINKNDDLMCISPPSLPPNSNSTSPPNSSPIPSPPCKSMLISPIIFNSPTSKKSKLSIKKIGLHYETLRYIHFTAKILYTVKLFSTYLDNFELLLPIENLNFQKDQDLSIAELLDNKTQKMIVFVIDTDFDDKYLEFSTNCNVQYKYEQELSEADIILEKEYINTKIQNLLAFGINTYVNNTDYILNEEYESYKQSYVVNMFSEMIGVKYRISHHIMIACKKFDSQYKRLRHQNSSNKDFYMPQQVYEILHDIDIVVTDEILELKNILKLKHIISIKLYIESISQLNSIMNGKNKLKIENLSELFNIIKTPLFYILLNI
jgi:hypothetical protein